MSTKNSAETAEVRLVRYAKLGSLPTVAMLTVSASSAAMSDQTEAALFPTAEKPAYDGGLETEGYFTTFGAPVEMSSIDVQSTIVVPVHEEGAASHLHLAGSGTDWSRTAELAEGADGIRSSRSA